MKFFKLEELCTEIIDCPHSTPKWLNKGIPVIRNYNLNNRGIDLTNLSFVDEETYVNRIKRAKPEAGDIVISREAPMGVVGMIPENFKCCLGQRLVLLKVNPKKCNPKYLLYALTSKFVQQQIKRIDLTGSIVSNLNIPDLKNLLIPIIEKQQDECAYFLDIIDSKIEVNNKINAELEAMAKTLYDYWFLQFEFPNEEGKPYKSSGGKMVWNEELKREIPEGWEVDALEKHIQLTKGISYTSKNIESKTGIPMINLASIDINRNYKPNELKYYTGVYNSQKEVFFGDMLIACTDLTRNADIIGSPVLVPNDKEKYVYSMDLAKIEIVDNNFNPLYLYMTLRTDFYHNYIKGFASGTNVLHLNTDGISWFKTYIPLKKIQDKFGIIIEGFHTKKCQIIKENQELTALRDFLLPLLMNGQVGFKE